MKRFIKNIIFIVVFVSLILFSFSCKKKEAWNGNLLIITMDTTRADHIGTYGYKEGNTPNIDKLAENGITFLNCNSAVPLTLPSHTTIFTGKYPIKHGVRNNGRYRLPDNILTMAELFKSAGYSTYGVISSFVLQSKFGLDKGFDVYDDSLDSQKAINTFETQITAKKVYEKFSEWFDGNWNENFFAWVHFYDPHSPYIRHSENSGTDPTDVISLYDGEITFMDKYIGLIIDNLDKKGILDKTIVVLIGDHGEAFGEHKENENHMVFCYQENIRVPFILFNKKLFKDSVVVDSPVSSVDIMPTVLKLAGIKTETDFDGVDLIPLINGGGETDRIIYFESMYGSEELNWAPLTGIIKGKYKYISLPKPELYDLELDPGERKNLYRKMLSESKDLDRELKKTVSLLSGTVKSVKRNLDLEDLKKLKALGYISSFAGKTTKKIDPKDGIVISEKLRKIYLNIDTGDPKALEKELLDLSESELGKDNFVVYNMLYKLYSKMKNTKKIIDILKIAINRLPDSVPFRMLFARTLIRLGKFKELISECKIILKIDPRNTGAYVLLGKVYEALGNIELSETNFEKAIDLEPKNISLKILFSEKLIKRQEFKKAVNIYNSITDLADVLNNVPLLFKIAMFNTRYGSLIIASRLFDAIEERVSEGKYFFLHALILSKIGRMPQALEKMKIALEKYGDQLSEREKSVAQFNIERWTEIR